MSSGESLFAETPRLRAGSPAGLHWAASGAAQVFLCGPHMEALWHKLAAAQKGVHRKDSGALAGEVATALRAGDVIAIKGSLGSNMKKVVDAVVAASGGESGR